MELNITEVVKAICGTPYKYSASIAELGNDAGKITWGNALDNEALLMNGYDRDEFIGFLRSFGAWTVDEINSWDDGAIRALVLQFIAADLRDCDFPLYFSTATNAWWTYYERQCSAGEFFGRMYRGDDGEIYFTIEE